MTADDIKQRIALLQDEINTLVAMLPADAQIAFGHVFVTKPAVSGQRKRLVVTFSEAPALAATEAPASA